MHARGRLALAGSDPATGQGISITRYEPVDERRGGGTLQATGRSR